MECQRVYEATCALIVIQQFPRYFISIHSGRINFTDPVVRWELLGY